MLGNDTDEAAVIAINAQTIRLAAAPDVAEAKRKSPDSPEIDLPPGKYKVTLKVASSAAQNREFEVARPGACWSVRPASRSPCTFIDMTGDRGGQFTLFTLRTRPATTLAMNNVDRRYSACVFCAKRAWH